MRCRLIRGKRRVPVTALASIPVDVVARASGLLAGQSFGVLVCAFPASPVKRARLCRAVRVPGWVEPRTRSRIGSKAASCVVPKMVVCGTVAKVLRLLVKGVWARRRRVGSLEGFDADLAQVRVRLDSASFAAQLFPRLLHPDGEGAPNGSGVGMLGAQHALVDGE